MSLEKPTEANKEIIQNPKIEDTHDSEEIKRYFAFADPLIGVDWGEEGVAKDYMPEYVSAHPEITQVFIAKDNEQIIAGAKIKMLDETEKVRLGLDQGDFEKQNGAILEYTAVKEEYRNKGLLADLTNKRIDWAKEHGATYICSEAEMINPISVYTKLRDGFVLVGVREPCDGIPHPYFVEVKKLNLNDNETTSDFKPEWKEVIVTAESFDELKKLFAEGWIGVDIKSSSEGSEVLSVPWILVMEKTS